VGGRGQVAGRAPRRVGPGAADYPGGRGASVRVLHVDTAAEWRGGQQLLLWLAGAQRRLGVDAAVACPPAGRLWAELGASGVPCIPIPSGWSLRTPALLAAARAGLHVAHTSHAHGCCAVLPHPLVVHRWVDAPVSGGWKYRRPQAYVACSEAVADVLRRAGCGGVSVVYAGCPVPPAVAPAADGPALLAVGARVPHKGHEVFADAVQILERRTGRRFDAGVAGDGPLRPPGLRLLGPRDDVPALLAAAAVLVHPSRSEGLGVAVVQALMAGVPVVASAVGGIPEVVGGDGELVPPGDAGALADGILRALAAPADRVAGAQGRARTRFTVDAMARGALRVYGEVCPGLC